MKKFSKMTANNVLMDVAMSQLGNKEIIGIHHEPEIMKYYNDIGHSWVNDDETPWCAAFLNWVCLHAMVPMTEKSQRLRARSFMNWGMTVKIDGVLYEHWSQAAKQGDIVVLWRGTPTSASGHAGLLIGWSPDGNYVYLLGGNQSNQVKISKYKSNRILDIRRNKTTPDMVFAPKIN